MIKFCSHLLPIEVFFNFEDPPGGVPHPFLGHYIPDHIRNNHTNKLLLTFVDIYYQEKSFSKIEDPPGGPHPFLGHNLPHHIRSNHTNK